MSDYSSYFDANKQLWNQRTAVHKDSSFYNLAGFKAGENVLTPIELNELGDVKGKTMLHLQCHFGMDSLNWARLGAVVTGVDLSDEAIKEAKQLNNDLGMNATFICCNVYDLKEHLNEKFDIVFTSYGTIGWLPDLNKWAEIISCYLKPGGIFYMADFHPVLWMFDDEFTHFQYSYENSEVIITESEGTYTDRDADITGKEYGWNHSISEILNALITNGLQIGHFNEFMYSPYACFRNTVEFEKGKWHIKGLEGKIPMVYSLKAVKQ
ncbi:MAG: class I SAM-dependent methyltransferase [Chitinophagaceae bacterium]|jgi:2-polyprenyl-3-methyl-5-hydroxy-6-metoxy-1,4-benzoquinol methylase|nr:class I SAM-dependent methyltransferase [Chitinophagaceae bacterium]MBK7680102.1 class I SAM-dependent methyltransferase [Chitinophagaceae bacterium]MBK8301062.1 class I SAM-dependent methyltransferase [Chitinophagaceae bacterium]MBK9660734.1 class I SAM-dependent methyltransferase [Chitinophagaceae bacterium]MBK9937810.1 class I SAM-dependent methyltransferase [Chitinophagaceae bacterium]